MGSSSGKFKNKKDKDWIQKADIKEGALREKLGVKEGKKIPAKKLAKALKSDDPKTRKQAVLAKTFKAMAAKKKAPKKK